MGKNRRKADGALTHNQCELIAAVVTAAMYAAENPAPLTEARRNLEIHLTTCNRLQAHYRRRIRVLEADADPRSIA